MNNISFDNPWLLFIALPLAAAVLIPFFITVRRDNVNFHNVASVSLHVIICICITLAVAGMSFKAVITETNVYVLADISYSAEHNLDDVQKSVERVAGKLPKNSKVGVICFGRNYQLISELGAKIPDVSSADKVDRSATDIGSALRYAGNLFDEDVIKRIIVVTDGAETVSANNLVKVVSSLQENGVYVDAVYINDNLSDDVKEVQLDGAEAASSSYLDKEEEVNVLIRANCGGDGRIDAYLTLTKNGVFEERKTVSLYSGLNTVSMPLATDETGAFEYELKIETVNAEDDTSPYNNTYLFTQKITDERKVLFIGASAADVAAGKAIYGENDVTYISDAAEVPLSVEEMCVYDEIALSNFDVRKVRASSMFMTSLTTLVDDYGKTLTTYGNTFVQDDDPDDKNSPLKQLAALLPVRIGNFDQDKRLVTIVLDVSTSMNFNSRFGVAKRTAIELINSLTSADTVLVVGFSGTVDEFLPPSTLTATKVLIEKINEKEAENGTNLGFALKYAHEKMPKRFRDRRVIIISDGMDGSSSAVTEAENMTREDIAVSAIGIFPSSDGDKLLSGVVDNSAISGKPYLQELVFYRNIKHESEVDGIIKQITDEQENIEIKDGSYDVTVRRPDETVAQGVGQPEAVGGFWYNAAKSTAKTVLTAKYYRDKITSFDVPLYAYWSGGNGKVVSFLSDITSWAGGWTDGTEGGKFLKNIPAATLPDVRINVPFIIDVEGNGNSTTLKVKTSQSLQNSTAFTAALTGPTGLVSEKALTFDSSEYFATFATDAPGTYRFKLDYNFNGLHYEAEAEFCVSYYAEYDSFTSYSKSSLYRLVSENGTIFEPDEITKLENSDSAYTSYVFDFTMPLMIVCAVLFITDIVIRQLKWKDVTSFFSGIVGRRR